MQLAGGSEQLLKAGEVDLGKKRGFRFGPAPRQTRQQTGILKRAAKTCIAYMSIDRGGRDILMPEKALQETEVQAVLKKQCGAGTAKHMNVLAPTGNWSSPVPPNISVSHAPATSRSFPPPPCKAEYPSPEPSAPALPTR